MIVIPVCHAKLSLCISDHDLYPVRILIVNDVTGAAESHTIAYVPYVHKRKEPGAKEKEKGRRWFEVDDVEWVRYFTKHDVFRPAKALLISRRPPRPQRLPRHPQWPGPQGPHGTSQGSARTSGGRPQPRTQNAAPHTNRSRSATPNGSPPKDLHTSTRSVTRQIQQLTTYARASCPRRTAEVHCTGGAFRSEQCTSPSATPSGRATKACSWTRASATSTWLSSAYCCTLATALRCGRSCA